MLSSLRVVSKATRLYPSHNPFNSWISSNINSFYSTNAARRKQGLQVQVLFSNQTRLLRKIPAFIERRVSSEAVAVDEAPSTEQIKKDYLALKPHVIQDLSKVINDQVSQDAVDWIAKLLEYSMFSDRRSLILARLMMAAYQTFLPPEEHSPERSQDFMRMAFLNEMLATAIMLSDDMTDGSALRRGKACWHLLPEVGSNAVNDVLLLDSGAWTLMWKYFGDKPYYLPLLHIVQTNYYRTYVGQAQDILAAQSASRRDFSMFTMDHYLSIVSNKTDHMMYWVLGSVLCMAGHTCPHFHRQVEEQAKGLMIYKQVENDFVDVYGEEGITRKIGTDIQAGKLTWLIVEALRRATPQQRTVLEECYGSHDPDKVQAVKNIYEELDVEAACIRFIEDARSSTQKRLNELPSSVLPPAFKLIMPFLDVFQKYTSFRKIY